MATESPVPVLDLFAGPGGLGEGFMNAVVASGSPAFDVRLSIEVEPTAQRTLELRKLYWLLRRDGRSLDRYLSYVRGDGGAPSRAHLFEATPDLAVQASRRAWQHRLGTEPKAVFERVQEAVAEAGDRWALIGGPPCQAYSIAGRSRMLPTIGRERFDADHRHELYKEYLQILADHAPAVFVMENVKGLLSATHKESGVFERIRADLTHPGGALADVGNKDVTYRLFTLQGVSDAQAKLPADRSPDSAEFVIRAEQAGIPQTRHRVIIMGLRDDLLRRYAATGNGSYIPSRLPYPPVPDVPIEHVIDDLPRLRSGLSGHDDDKQSWQRFVQSAPDLWRHYASKVPSVILCRAETAVTHLPEHRGGRFVAVSGRRSGPTYRADWFVNAALGGFLNHETRSHIGEDLHRYLYAACSAAEAGRSPTLKDFPEELHPEHANVEKALSGGMFNDRFRVQARGRPATTVTSHISRDGHYFIHYDPAQCRSLTVREAARVQTFPDDYFFEGPRTAQYVQVGNAVPPLLAVQIADIVREALDALV